MNEPGAYYKISISCWMKDMKKLVLIILLIVSLAGYTNEINREADNLWNEGMRFKQEKKYEKAIEVLKRAVIAERKKNIPRKEELFNQLQEIGSIYLIIGEHPKALHYYKLLVKVAEESGNNEGIAISKKNLGDAYFQMKRLDEALESYNAALVTAKDLKIQDIALVILDSMARIYRDKNEYNRSLELYKEALKLAEVSSYKNNIAPILSNIGTLYYSQKKYDIALDHYQRALDQDKKHEGRSISSDLSNIGCTYAAMGKYGEAVNYIEQALDIDIKQSNTILSAARLSRLGDVYWRIGDNIKALDYYQRSLDVYQKYNEKMFIAEIYSCMGEIYDSMGKFDEAINMYMKALMYNKEIINSPNISNKMIDIGLAYETRKRYNDALEMYSTTLLLDVLSDKTTRAAYILNNIGRVMLEKKEFNKAIDYFNQSLSLYTSLNHSIDSIAVLNKLGIAHCLKREYNDAEKYFLRSIMQFEKMKEIDKLNNIVLSEDACSWLLLVYSRNQQAHKALPYLNRLHRISNGSEKIYNESGGVPDTEHGIDAAAINTNTIYISFANSSWDSPLQIVNSHKGLSIYELDKEKFVKEIYTKLGKEIEATVAVNNAAWFNQDKMRYKNEYYRLEFQKILEYLRRLLMKPYINDEEMRQRIYLSKMIYAFLFKAVQPELDNVQKIVILPDQILSFLPFEILVMNDGRFLIEKYVILYAKSLITNNQRNYFHRGKFEKEIIIRNIGYESLRIKKMAIESVRHYNFIINGLENRIINSLNIREIYRLILDEDIKDIPSSNIEMTSMDNIFPKAKIYQKSTATETEFKSMISSGNALKNSLIHITGKFTCIPSIPQLSAITLGDGAASKDDGFVNCGELSRLSIPAKLFTVTDVVPYSITYGRGSAIGSYVVSLTRAGVLNALIPMWSIDSISKSIFFNEFYQLVNNENTSIPEAMAITKRKFIKNTLTRDKQLINHDEDNSLKYSNPYYWGSFVMYNMN